jgi:hypothetical protein
MQLRLSLPVPIQRFADLCDCSAVVGMQIDTDHHGDTKLDDLRIAGVFSWPGPIHLGNGQAFPIAAQRDAILRITSGQDTKPGATMFNVFASMLSEIRDPLFTTIGFDVDVKKRQARLKVAGYIDQRAQTDLPPRLPDAPRLSEGAWRIPQ